MPKAKSFGCQKKNRSQAEQQQQKNSPAETEGKKVRERKKKSLRQREKERDRDVRRSDAGEAHCQCVYCGPRKRGSYLCGVLVE